MSQIQTVLVVSYGRSGSTLLTGILNSLPGYLIRGENYNCFYGLHQFFEAAGEMRNMVRSDPTSAWYNRVETGLLHEDARKLFRDFLDPRGEARVVGFKEIRWCEIGDRAAIFRYLDFLHMLTGCVFIYHTRDLECVTSSQRWMRDKRPQLEDFENQMTEYQCMNPGLVYHTTYEDIVRRTEVMQGLFAFLGESCPADLDRVLQTRHGYGSFPNIRLAQERLRSNIRFPKATDTTRSS